MPRAVGVALDDQDACIVVMQLRVVASQHHLEQLAERPRVLHARRPPARDDEGQPRPPLGGVGLVRRSLETRQHMVAEPKRFLEVLEADREAREIGIAEVVVHAAGCKDAHVVGDLRAVVEPDDPPSGVEASHGALTKPDIGRAAEDPPERVGDVGGIQQRRRDLVQERREQVIVVGVHEEHVHRLAVEPPGAGEAAEASADDDDTRSAHRLTLSPGPRAACG